MWKDNDFRELLANYRLDPPQQVWTNVSGVLEMNRRQKVLLPYFTHSQKLALIAASLSSILLCGFMLRFVEDSPENKVNFQSNNELIKSNSAVNETILYSSQLSSVQSIPTIQNNANPVVKKIAKASISIPKEFKPFEKEILALAELDRQIAVLGEEIDKLKAVEPIKNAWEAPILSQIQTNTEAKTNQNWQKYQNLLKDEMHPVAAEVKLAEVVTTRPKFIERFYLTPYMGANYSQVFYQDKPANNFFSDKAQFSGQIGYNSGVQFGFQLTKKWSLESGVGLGQYILGFKEDYGTHIRDGNMYVDQLDIPFLIRYSLDLNKKQLPLTLALKGGLIYSNVIFYQVNYTDKFNRVVPVGSINEQSYSFDVDKRQYNSMQFGYAAGLDLDAFVSKKISLNFSMLNALVSQLNNFPFFSNERQRPIQFSSSFSIGTKIRF